VKEHGPDGPYSTQLRGALDDRLDLRSGDPEPNQPKDGLHATIVVVTAATDGGLLSPLRESAMRGANAQNGTIHSRMRNTPTRRRNGDMPADFAASVDDPSPMQIPGSIRGACSRTPRWWRHPIAKSIRPPGADHGLPHRGEPGCGQSRDHSVNRALRPRSYREPIWEPDSSDLLACFRTHSDAEWLGKGGGGSARW
jgi:hypothetical protein